MRKDRRRDHPARAGARSGPDREDRLRIHGIHAVAAVLANRRRDVLGLRVTENAAERLSSAIRDRGVRPESVQPRDLDRILGPDTVHQGALVETTPLPEPDLRTLLELATRGGPLLVLDQVTDPHNVGAIVRSAAVFGASGIVMTRRNAPQLAGALAKAASGALEIVPIGLVTNLARALEEMAEQGLQRIGLDGEAATLIDDADLRGPLALVLGSEGKGLRRLTRESCDRLCRIGASSSLASLNVSNAAAVTLYAASLCRRRGDGRDTPPATTC